MNRDFWETVSVNYKREVLSVFDNDHEGLVEERIGKAAKLFRNGTAADIGCGVGRFTPVLSKAFKQVDASDFSLEGLKRARRRCRSCDNIKFHEWDLTRGEAPFSPVDLALCVNVILMPSLSQRRRAWHAVCSQVKDKGSLILVLPSMESAQMEHYRMVGAWLDDGSSCSTALKNSIQEKATVNDLRMGVYQLDGMRTKHYLREEICDALESRAFEVEEFRKLKYPPGGDEAPFESWDWLFVARRM